MLALMRYIVLLRYGLWEWQVALTVSRSQDGDISSTEPLRQRYAAGMMWSANGLYRLTTDTSTDTKEQRAPLTSLREPEIAYSIPGVRLLDGSLPPYTTLIPERRSKSVPTLCSKNRTASHCSWFWCQRGRSRITETPWGTAGSMTVSRRCGWC
jgi:hypothetical protein